MSQPNSEAKPEAKSENNSQPHPLLGNLSATDFLNQYWQKKPLLIRQAMKDFQPILSAEELAGMSCEDGIESRLILENGPRNPWQCDSGPFTEQDYQALPESHWTLLIQAVDLWVPEAAELLQQFDFLPQWRRDDLMISFATDGGSVGPHYDQYDVFLLQAEGQRHWQVGQWCTDLSELLADGDLRILKQFDAQQDWILEPGDMLYLPPQLAHFGRAVGHCMTYSIGFRAPSKKQLLERWVDTLAPRLSEDQRFHDAARPATKSQGLIDSSAIDSVRDLLTSSLKDDALLGELLGSLTTEAKYSELGRQQELEIDADQCQQYLEQGLQINPCRRFAYQILPDRLQFFVDGDSYHRPLNELELIELLSNQKTYSVTEFKSLSLSMGAKEFIKELIEYGDLIPLSDD